MLLNISQEIEYIWLKPFSFPTLFYIFTRYIPFIEKWLFLASYFLPISAVSHASLRKNLCQILISPSQFSKTLRFWLLDKTWNQKVVWHSLPYTRLHGISGIYWCPRFVIPDLVFETKLNNYLGLLVTRTYSLCHRNKFIVAALGLGLLAGLILTLLRKNSLFLVWSDGNLTPSRDNNFWWLLCQSNVSNHGPSVSWSDIDIHSIAVRLLSVFNSKLRFNFGKISTEWIFPINPSVEYWCYFNWVSCVWRMFLQRVGHMAVTA